mmetsp:Transcript_1037/g.1714  ORF Transcript_1037/g.1714 Transcript_1037/m.1714 type:complete len:198 (-) Transcript_1037:1250-1843(-)
MNLRILLEGKKDIEEVLTKHREDLLALKRHSAVVPTKDILDTAALITYACYAPKEYVIGMPLLKAHPPAPQPEQMRIGALQNYNTKYRQLQDSSDAPHGESSHQTGEEYNVNSFALQLKNEMMQAKKRDRDREIEKEAANASMSGPMEEDQGSSEIPTTAEPSMPTGEAENEAMARHKARKVELDFGMSDSDDSSDA